MISIRLAFPTDKEACLSLAQQSGMVVPSADTLDYLIGSQQMWLAEKDSCIIGSVSYQLLWNDTLCFQFFRVDTQYKDSDVGEKLLKKMESVAKELNRKQLIACTTDGDDLFINLHKKLNFTEIGKISIETSHDMIYRKTVE